MICRDINECLDGALNGAIKCQSNSQCHNIPGSYECKCVTGYHAVIDECHDTNECDPSVQPLLHKCDPDNSFCINTDGSYTCDCKDGYTKIGDFCYDIDEVDFQKMFPIWLSKPDIPLRDR